MTIPNGATIVSAILYIYANDNGQDLTIDICGEDADNAVPPTSAAEANALTLTTATENWGFITAIGWEESPDISSIIQEIVDREGWVSGNDLQIILLNSGSKDFSSFQAYDSPGTNEAVLEVEWTV